MFATSIKAVGVGKSGLMDILAGGHVDDATFTQAVDLLKLEDWASLKLLLAGQQAAGSKTCLRKQRLDATKRSRQ